MFNVVLVLCVLVDLGWTQTKPSTDLTCDQLPKVPFPRNEKWSASGPLVVELVLSSFAHCSTLIFLPPERGSVDHTGYAFITTGHTVTTFQYTESYDGKTANTIDSTGRNLTWYCMDADRDGAFHCAYVCDGPALHEFVCATSNNNKFKHRIENAVAWARQIPNGDKIHPAQKNCPKRKHFVF